MIHSRENLFCDDTQFLCSKLDDQIIFKSLEISIDILALMKYFSIFPQNQYGRVKKSSE